MSAVAFAEALQEFAQWDRKRAREYFNASTAAKYQPREKAGRIIQRRAIKQRRELAPPMQLRIEDELSICGCGKTFFSKNSFHKKCWKCRQRTGSKLRSCIDCNKDFRSPSNRRCPKCTKQRAADTHAPCKCGRPFYCAKNAIDVMSLYVLSFPLRSV